MKRAAASSGVLVLHKTVDILEALRASPSGMALGALAAQVGMPKATVYRILATLGSRGYLDHAATGEYRIGRRLFALNGDGASAQGLVRAARPAMEKLLAVSKETLNLGVLDGGDVLVIETLESPLAVR